MVNEDINVRLADKKDIEQFMDLVMRMKRLNGEFDSLFKANEDNLAAIRAYYEGAIGNKEKYITLVATHHNKLCGLIKAEIRDRVSYIPDKEARINDLYIMPEFRRKNVGNKMLEKLYEVMKSDKISVVSAEFPALNLIALNFYKKIGYREIGSVFGRDISDADSE